MASSVTSYTITGLDSDTSYDVRMFTTKTGAEDSVASSTQTLSTQAPKPAKPAAPTVSFSITNRTITVNRPSLPTGATRWDIQRGRFLPTTTTPTALGGVRAASETSYTAQFQTFRDTIGYRLRTAVEVGSGNLSDWGAWCVLIPDAPVFRAFVTPSLNRLTYIRPTWSGSFTRWTVQVNQGSGWVNSTIATFLRSDVPSVSSTYPSNLVGARFSVRAAVLMEGSVWSRYSAPVGVTLT